MNNLQHLTRAAIAAHNGTSFDPEKRGVQMIAGYEETLADDLKQIEAASEETKAQYISRFSRFLSNYLTARSRIVSPMIAGPSNFPTRRMQKYGNWEDNAYKRFQDFRTKAIVGIKKQIERDKPQEQKENEAWLSIRRTILDKCVTITMIDSGENTYTSRALIVSNLTGFIKRIAQNGQVEHTRKAIELIREMNAKGVKPILTEKNEVFRLLEAAEAKAETKRDISKQEAQEFTFNGGIVIANYEINRIQIKHDSKPSAEVIAKLKKNAFKWSPSQGVWQRQLTSNAIHAVNKLTGLNLKSI